MSQALRRVRDLIRIRLRETDARFPSFVVPEVDHAICDAYLFLQARLPAAELHSASAGTISAGTDLFTLPATVTQWTGNDGGAEYAGQVRIRLTSTGQFLIRATQDELQAFRDGNASTVLSVPRYFTLWEEKDQDVQGRCYPGALAAETYDLFVSLDADDLRDFVGTGSDDLDDVEVQFSRLGTQALVRWVAADLLERMTDEDLKLRRLSRSAGDSWRKEAETLIYHEASRRHHLYSSGRTQQWVS